MLRSIRDTLVPCHITDTSPQPLMASTLSPTSASLTKCIRQYLSRMSCFWDVMLPQLFHLKMPHNVIIRTLIMWGPRSGHELGYWRLIYHSGSIIITIIISWRGTNWELCLVIYANAPTISNVSIMTADCVTLCPREHRAGHIASALSIIFKTSDVCWSRVSCQAWDLLWTKYL